MAERLCVCHEGATGVMEPDAAKDAGLKSESLQGVPRKISDRHAFVYERLLILVARETETRGGFTAGKREAADMLGCSQRSIDRAVTRLRREKLLQSVPQYNKSGAQIENEYRATDKGQVIARWLVGKSSSMFKDLT